MKFWKRIFIYSITLFLIVFSSAGIFIIETIHKRSLDRTIKSVIDEHKLIEDTIYLNTDSAENLSPISPNQLKDWLNLILTGYWDNGSVSQNGLELYDENNTLLFSKSSQTVPEPRDEITNSKLDERLFIIRNINDKHYLFVSSKFFLENNTLKLILTKDINSIYEERKKNYQLFFALDGIVFVLLALGMYLIVKGTTKPISKLSEASKEIADGNYSKRVQIKNRKDEISILAENFNIMAEATSTTIEELKDLNSAKQRFIDSLTHEFKTPLTSIIGYSDLLIKGNLNEELRFKALNYINSESRRLETLNSTLLKLILIKQENLSVQNFSLKNCIVNAYTSLRYKIENKNLEIKFDIEDTELCGDKQLILVLFINILDNAIKASNNNGVIEIQGHFIKNSSTYKLSFKDYGIGIPKEDLDKIKEPFYMVDKSRDRAKNGVGLGLAICEEICATHKLNLSISSECNNYTKVSISFFTEEKSI